MYDVIVVGARCAGAATAMLLARGGLEVLLVDKARFPSEVIANAFMQYRGNAYLHRWGLLERLMNDTDTPHWQAMHVDVEGIHLSGQPDPEAIRRRHERVHGWKEPTVSYGSGARRSVLDPLLADAAAAAGAEVRLQFTVEELIEEDGRVTGIRGRTRDGDAVVEKARIVVGADGRHSFVARAVGAERYNERNHCTYDYYTFFSGVPCRGLELWIKGRLTGGAYNSNRGLTFVGCWGPRAWFHDFRADLPGNFMRSIEALSPEFAERLRQGKREERIYGTADQPNAYLKPWGPGWALVGDAGYMKDQCTAIGMTHAFRDAQLLSDALVEGLGGGGPLDAALAGYHRRRDEDSAGYYDFVCGIAEMNMFPAQQLELFAAMRGNQPAIDAFLGAFGDVVPVQEFFADASLGAIMGAADPGLSRPAVLLDYEARAAAAQRCPYPRVAGARSGVATVEVVA